MSNIGIYMIVNTINGKKYIGQSKNLTKRFKRHFSELRNNNHVNSHLQRAFNKYGENNFIFKVILNCKEDELTYYENFFIQHFNSKNNGYNILDANENIPNNKGKNNGMYGALSPIRRIDIDDHIYEIAEQYKQGMLIKDLAKEWNTARQVLRTKLRMVLSKEEMASINLKNQKSGNIDRTKNKGISHTLESRINMSKSSNTSGYYRVSLDKSTNRWSYSYYQNNKRRKITAKTIELLKEKVIQKGLEWIKYE